MTCTLCMVGEGRGGEGRGGKEDMVEMRHSINDTDYKGDCYSY